MFLKNCWYVAAWDHELIDGKLLARTILEEAVLLRSGASLHVPPQQSILEVLEANGDEVAFSCREGLCGTCETTVCEGAPDHRDYVYPPSQRASLRTMLVCVSRAKSARLVLDL